MQAHKPGLKYASFQFTVISIFFDKFRCQAGAKT